MRFLVLQQVGGDLVGVYDVSMGDMVRIFEGKNARRKAAEFQAILEAGWEKTATVEGTEAMRIMRNALLSSEG